MRIRAGLTENWGRRAGLSQTAVSNVISGNRKAGPEFCVKVARAFGVPPEKVLRLAGILPSITSADDPQIIEATEMLRNMSSEKRAFVMKLLRMIYRDQTAE